MQEEWRAVVGWEGLYEVSSLGKVKSIRNNKLLKCFEDKLGRQQCTLSVNNKQNYCRVHRLVAQAFIPNPEDKPFINHIDNNPANNDVKNIEWCTPLENMLHKSKQGRGNQVSGEKHPAHKLTTLEVIEIKELLKLKSYIEVGKLFNINRTTIYDILKNKTWKHITI